MRTLEKRLEECLRVYVSEAECTSKEDFEVDYPTAIDIELINALLARRELKEFEIPKEVLPKIKEADEKFLRLYEQVRHTKSDNPAIKIAIEVLKDIVSEIKENPL